MTPLPPISIIAAAAFAALLAGSAPASAQAPIPPPPSSGLDRATTGSVVPDRGPASPPASTYETDGNAKNPGARNVPGAPAYQQGSGQETGGPARELIPR